MQTVKKILQSDTVVALACFLLAQYIRLVRWTGRWRFEGEDIPESFRTAGQPFIMTFWHGRIMMMPYAWRRTDLVKMLASGHRDGRIMSGIVKHFGVDSVVGSTSKGGAEATRRLIRLLRGGGVMGITPDGPRGPRMRASEGAVVLARLSGAKILPVSFSASRRRLMKSWDRYVLALPFSRGIFLWGEPIAVPRDADDKAREAIRLELEDALNRLSDRADAMMGQPPVAPDLQRAADGPAKPSARRKAARGTKARRQAARGTNG